MEGTSKMRLLASGLRVQLWIFGSSPVQLGCWWVLSFFFNLQADYCCGFSVLRNSRECSGIQNTLKWSCRCVEGKVILAENI